MRSYPSVSCGALPDFCGESRPIKDSPYPKSQDTCGGWKCVRWEVDGRDVGMWELSWTDGWRLPSLPLEVGWLEDESCPFWEGRFPGGELLSVSGPGVISGAFCFSIVASSKAPQNLPRSHRIDFDVFHCSSRYTLVPPANSSGISCPARTKNAILLQ